MDLPADSLSMTQPLEALEAFRVDSLECVLFGAEVFSPLCQKKYHLRKNIG